MTPSCQADRPCSHRIASSIAWKARGRANCPPGQQDKLNSATSFLGADAGHWKPFKKKVFGQEKHSRALAPKKNWRQGQHQETGCKSEPGLRASLSWRIWGVQSLGASRELGSPGLHRELRALGSIHSQACMAGQE